MALENENGMGTTMLVQPTGMNNGGFGNAFGGDGFWIILLFLLLGGGWGMGGFGGWGGMMGAGMMGMDYLYPWLNNSQHMSDGFRDQQISTNLNGIQGAITSGFGDVQLGIAGVNQNICQTGNGIVSAVNSGFNAAESANNARQIANMQQAFAAQTAQMQGFNGLQAQLAQCCCDNRSTALENRYSLATEACATRTAAAENTRDIIDSQARGTQAILDKLCAIELDTVKSQLAQAQRDNVGLQNQLNMANLAYSQAQQTDAIKSDNTAQTQYIVNRVAPYPQPAIVYGYNTQWMNGGCNSGCGCA